MSALARPGGDSDRVLLSLMTNDFRSRKADLHGPRRGSDRETQHLNALHWRAGNRDAVDQHERAILGDTHRELNLAAAQRFPAP